MSTNSIGKLILFLTPMYSWGEIVIWNLKAKTSLLDLGLVPGTKMEMAFPSPLGDPKAYRVRDTILALRANEAMSIMVRRLEP